MTTYHLYRSGIHEATFYFHTDTITFKKRDVWRNEWEAVAALRREDATYFEKIYHMNPAQIKARLRDYEAAFAGKEDRVKTSWGALYHRHREGMWVEREKKFPLDVLVEEGEALAFVCPSRENTVVLVKEGYEAETPLALWENAKLSQAKYGIHFAGTFRAEMRDGIGLATDVYLPDCKGEAFPVIFVRTPYGKAMYERAYTHFIRRGYGVVIQDTRGREDSEGEWIPMYAEVEDGDDSLDWIAAQAWCDGNIGMIGASYGGYVQWAAAASGNPHLKAMVSMVTAGSPFIDIPRKGGAFVSGVLAWAFAMVERKFKPENMMRDDWDEIVKIRPIGAIPKQVLGKDVAFWDRWLAHEANDAFWRKSSWTQDVGKITAPAFVVSGWFDDNGMGTTEALEVIEKYAPEDKRVVLGPWLHNGNAVRDIQGVALGDNALRYDLDVQFQQWFDWKLKGVSQEIAEGATVEYYDTGVNAWKTAATWPPENMRPEKWYLAEGALATSGPDGQAAGKASYVYDPENPAPFLIDMSENEVGAPADYQEVERRDDVLVFSTEALEESVTVAGDVLVRFHASSSARDTDWVVRVMDVHPDGKSVKLVEGVLRARFRHGFEQEVLLEPGSVEAYEIRTSKLANTFKKGHKIRLSITSSADNFIFPNTNTGHDPARDVASIRATQTVYYTADYPSYIALPVIK